MSYLLLQNATMFDGSSEELTEQCSILIENETIAEVSALPIRTSKAEIIDCTGKFVMPGMIDNHVHVYFDSLNITPPGPPLSYRAHYAARFLQNALRCGFTSVRDVGGGDHGLAMALRAGFLTGPRYFYGGLCLTQTGGHGDFRSQNQEADPCACGAERNFYAIHADGVDECVKATRDELRKGASHIKIMGSGGVLSPNDPIERSQYSEAEIRAIVDECARQGAYVAAHCCPAEAIRRCAEYGVRSIEHGTLIDRPTAEFVAEMGAFVVPTMAVLEALYEDGRAMGLSESSYSKLQKIRGAALEGLDIMRQSGVKMGFGTDLLGAQHIRQCSEFLIRRRALPALDILRSATSINASILQMDGRLGVIAPGALADILVVDENPLENIEILSRNGEGISYIIMNGRVVKGL